MFEFERHISAEAGIVASESQRLSAQDRQRDVFESHRYRVFAIGYYMTANELEAEEILTGTFVTAFSAQKEPDAAKIDQALIGELERRFSLAPEPSATLDPALMLNKTASHRTDLEEALRLLPPSERLIFLLKDVEGYPAARIAPLLQMEEAEVQRAILSARIRMRNALAAAQKAAQARALAAPTRQHQDWHLDEEDDTEMGLVQGATPGSR